MDRDLGNHSAVTHRGPSTCQNKQSNQSEPINGRYHSSQYAKTHPPEHAPVFATISFQSEVTYSLCTTWFSVCLLLSYASIPNSVMNIGLVATLLVKYWKRSPKVLPLPTESEPVLSDDKSPTDKLAQSTHLSAGVDIDGFDRTN